MGAVIWCAIVVVWVLVLIPVWLRRHDDAVAVAAHRSAAPPLTTARRVLSRRSPGAPVRRWVVLGPGQTGHDELADPVSAAASTASAGADVTDPARRGARRRSRPARSAYVGRRRRLGALLAAVLLTLVLVPLRGGRAALLLQLVADVALAAYLVHLRRLARAGRPTTAHRARPSDPGPSPRPVRARVEPEPAVPVGWDEADDEEPGVAVSTARAASGYGPDRPWRRQLRPQVETRAAGDVEAPFAEPVAAAGPALPGVPAPRTRPAALLRDALIDGEDVTDADLLLGRRAVGH